MFVEQRNQSSQAKVNRGANQSNRTESRQQSYGGESNLKSPGISRVKSADPRDIPSPFSNATTRISKVDQNNSPDQSPYMQQQYNQKNDGLNKSIQNTIREALISTILEKEQKLEAFKQESKRTKKVEDIVMFENHMMPKKSKGLFNYLQNPTQESEIKPSIKVKIQQPLKNNDENLKSGQKMFHNQIEKKRNPIIEGDEPKTIKKKTEFESSTETQKLNIKKHFLPCERAELGSPSRQSQISRQFYNRMALNEKPPEEKVRPLHPLNNLGRDMRALLQYEFYSIKEGGPKYPENEFASPRRNRVYHRKLF